MHQDNYLYTFFKVQVWPQIIFIKFYYTSDHIKMGILTWVMFFNTMLFYTKLDMKIVNNFIHQIGIDWKPSHLDFYRRQKSLKKHLFWIARLGWVEYSTQLVLNFYMSLEWWTLVYNNYNNIDFFQ